MMRRIQIGTYSEENAIRAGGFSLMPTYPNPPFIASQPVQNFQQETWIESVVDSTPKFQQIQIQYNTINMLLGTQFTLGLLAADPSNINNYNDTTQLSYRWKKKR